VSARAAAPPGRATLEKVQGELSKGWPPGLTVLTGDDLFHLDRAQRALLDTLAPEEDSGFALTVYGDEKVDVAKVVAAARSVGMFASRRVVLVRDLLMLDGEPDAIEAFAASPPPESYLIVRAPTLDQRRKLHKSIAKHGHLLAFGAGGDPRQAADDIAAIAAEKGLTLDRDALRFLAGATFGDLYRASSELEKADLWIGGSGKRRLGLDQLLEIASGGGLMSGWEVANAVYERDHGAALAAVRRLVDDGDEPLRILGGVAWRSRILLQAMAMVEEGASPDRAMRSVNAFGCKAELAHALRRYSFHEVLAFPGYLLQADRTIKSRSIPPRVVLEELMDRMIRSPRARESERA
jgi:DNA polymerase-3 subunit delta